MTIKPGTILCLGLFALISSALLPACSTTPVQRGKIVEPVFPANRILEEDTFHQERKTIADPLEGYNRIMYRFNYEFDKYVFLPAVHGYQWITPDIAEKGIHNFFQNLRDIPTLINSILQLNAQKTVNTVARLTLNSTVGLLGFIDVAKKIPRSDEDFGQTLGYWGLKSGPYLVLPILGPSSLRDSVGVTLDSYTFNYIRNQLTDLNTGQNLSINALWSLDTRANIAFRYYETGSPFEYELVRVIYTTKRALDIER